MALLCNNVSHWLGANLESALQTIFDEYGWYWPVTIPTQTIMQHEYIILHIDGLVQDCSISSANALEILQSCNKLFTCAFHFSARLNITTQMCEDLLNIMVPSYLYVDSHHKDERILWPSYLYNGNAITWILYIEIMVWSALKSNEINASNNNYCIEFMYHPWENAFYIFNLICIILI